jgi:hypothetical protein
MKYIEKIIAKLNFNDLIYVMIVLYYTDLFLVNTHVKEKSHRNSDSWTNVKKKYPCWLTIPTHHFTNFSK